MQNSVEINLKQYSLPDHTAFIGLCANLRNDGSFKTQ